MQYRAVFLDAFYTLWYMKRSATEIWYELLADMSEGRSIEQIRAAEAKEQEELLERWASLETFERPNDLALIEAVWEDYDSKIMNHLGLSVDLDTLSSEITPRFFDMLALFDETRGAGDVAQLGLSHRNRLQRRATGVDCKASRYLRSFRCYFRFVARRCQKA